MENKKVYCKECKFVETSYIKVEPHRCSNIKNQKDSPYEAYAPSIKEVNKDNDCPFYEYNKFFDRFKDKVNEEENKPKYFRTDSNNEPKTFA